MSEKAMDLARRTKIAFQSGDELEEVLLPGVICRSFFDDVKIDRRGCPLKHSLKLCKR